VSLSRRSSRLASPASVECYWERPRERHSRPQVAFLALGCHSVARFGDCLTSRLRQFAGAPRRWLRPEGGRCAAAPSGGRLRRPTAERLRRERRAPTAKRLYADAHERPEGSPAAERLSRTDAAERWDTRRPTTGEAGAVGGTRSTTSAARSPHKPQPVCDYLRMRGLEPDWRGRRRRCLAFQS
jgi:hypothetical protein